MAFTAPFPPLIPGGDGLEQAPGLPFAVGKAMADLYGVDQARLIVTRGALHAYEILFRHLRRNGADGFTLGAGGLHLEADIRQLASVYGFGDDAIGPGLDRALMIGSPSLDRYDVFEARDVESLAAGTAPGLLVLDESLIDFTTAESMAAVATRLDNVVVIRSLEMSHGLAGAPCGALIANGELIADFDEMVEAFAVSTATARAAEAALSPSRALATASRIAEVAMERDRLAARLASALGAEAAEGSGPYLLITPRDRAVVRKAFRRLGVEADWIGRDQAIARVLVRPGGNEALLAAFGLPAELKPHRRAEQVRDTKETRITVRVDLDAPGQVKVQTGFGFYDHMLEQIAVHGGFSLQLGCEGDLHIDAHHVIEDCALALGAALDKALGDRRGIGRFGFVLPMDEAEARISIDLGGRPYCDFTGEFAASRLGDYPTQMTGHVFRSLSESLRAAIHLEVRGDNDHHKVEACFKAFGRALRQAIRVEGAEMPSSKGVL